MEAISPEFYDCRIQHGRLAVVKVFADAMRQSDSAAKGDLPYKHNNEGIEG
jgi:hypothetical protein